MEVTGSRVHNLKNIDAVIPRNALTVITGLSGSGKSSLAFDTIFAEGQRRYIETFSAYARSFLGNLERPDVDEITGLSPVISIEQKTTNKNPRSTVGTTTEVYDFLRLLFARAGMAYSYLTGEKMVKYTEEQIVDIILKDFSGKKIYLLAPLVRARKGHYKELFENIRKKGYLQVRIDGEIQEITHGLRLDRYKIHNIEVVIDKLQVAEKDRKRLTDSMQKAMNQGNGVVMVAIHPTAPPTPPKRGDVSGVQNTENAGLRDVPPLSGGLRYFSRSLMCPTTGISYEEPAPHHFSFNSPQGACPHCKGLGFVNDIDFAKIVPEKTLSIHDGAIAPLGKYRATYVFRQIETILQKNDFSLKTPFAELSDEVVSEIMNGSDERMLIKNEVAGTSYMMTYEGILRYIELQAENSASASEQKWANQYYRTAACPECKGARLRKESLCFCIHDKNIAELAAMDLSDLYQWLKNCEPYLSEKQRIIATEILKEILTRLGFLLDVGLNYLSLNRPSQSLSGGESQRIRLATHIGSQLVNVLYILDEPSIGLHQRDNERLIKSLKQLRDIGNSVIVVEHDKEMMLAADYIIDMGPFAGRKGGEVVFAGTPEQLMNANSQNDATVETHNRASLPTQPNKVQPTSLLTADYLTGKRKIEIPEHLRTGNGKTLKIIGASGNNLKNIDVEFPLGTMMCITGVSGSGKSTLVTDTLQPILSQHFYRSLQNPLAYKEIIGIENIDKVVEVNQAPIGRTPRSNPATYVGVFSDIRNLFTTLPEAKIRGYKAGRFSFNTAGGRCETCSGNGYKTIEMNFLPDVYVPCETCGGKRYNRETLEVRFKGKSIADVLDMTINKAVEFFENQPSILNKIKTLQDVGLGYIKLGQSSTTLSGGESQRVKLATELSKRDTGKTLYILDEPTTGLHFEDIRVLLGVLNKLVDKGNTVIIIEHNLDVIKVADYIIDMGPEGGQAGGKIIATGTPKEIAGNKKSITGRFLKGEMEN
ncbi:UvrABC system protein A [Bacteroidia bacterium]|nr:UvrABC system protein A [Bacteroidia bacterium]